MLVSYLYFCIALQVLMHAPGILAGVPAVIIFGDSSVDTGNNNYISTIARSNFRPYGRDFKGGVATGRFSNGRLATDYISQAFGLSATVPAYLDPKLSIKDFVLGVSFASAASGYDNATADVLSVIPLWKQLEYYKEYQQKLRKYQGEAKANQTIAETVYIISIGTNDFLENYYSAVPGGRSSEFTVEKYQDFLVGIAERFLLDVYRLGGRKINFAGLPPMGCLPLERMTNFMSFTNCNEDYNSVAAQFNTKLKGMMDRAQHKLSGSKLVYSNLYDLFSAVIANPNSYGFEDVMTGCCATGLFEMGYVCNRSPLICRDPNEYVFWDAIHPTEKMNRLIANSLMKSTLYVYR